MPFAKSLKYDHIAWAAREELIAIRSDNLLEVEYYNEKSISEFWIRRQQEYSSIEKEALVILIPFPTTCRCETAFSSLILIKNKHRPCLSMET